MNLKRLAGVVASTILLATAGVAAPASAAPAKFELPSYCHSGTGKTISASAISGRYAKLNFHPRAGKEYVYVVDCLDKDYKPKTFVGVTTTKGKLIASKSLGKKSLGGYPFDTSGKTIRVDLHDYYKGTAHFQRDYKVSWSTKSKRIVLKPLTGVPSVVKAVYKLERQVNSGSTINGMKATKAQQKKLRYFSDRYLPYTNPTSSCVPRESGKYACGLGYTHKQNYYATGISFTVKKKDGKWTILKITHMGDDIDPKTGLRK